MPETDALPKVSIIIPVRNGARHLAALRAQLLALTMIEDAEVLLIDDGSTDESGPLMRELAGALPRASYLTTGPVNGVAVARNLGIARAAAPYVWFVDCDDDFEPSILQVLYEAAAAVDADLVVCQADLVSESGNRLRRLDRVDVPGVVSGPELLDAVLVGQINGYLWNKLIRRSLLSQSAYPPMTSQEDMVRIIGLLPKVVRAVLIEPTLYHHVVHRGSITNSANPDLNNLRRVQQAMTATLETMGVDPKSPRARYFHTKLVRYSICNTGYRLSEQTPRVARIQQQARQEIGLRDVLSVARLDPAAGAAVAVLRYSEPTYRRLLGRRWRRLAADYYAPAP